VGEHVEQSHAKYALSIEERSPHDWAQLVCKLRWIGMPEEARRLELAVNTLRPEERASVLGEPLSTD
jgi:hypothetical protein